MNANRIPPTLSELTRRWPRSLKESCLCLAMTVAADAVAPGQALAEVPDLALDHQAGKTVVSELGITAREWILGPDGRLEQFELKVTDPATPNLVGVSHGAMHSVYHFAKPGTPYLSAVAFPRDGSGSNPRPAVLIDRLTQATLHPSADKTLFLAELGFGELLSTGHVETTGQEVVSLAVVRAASGEVGIIDRSLSTGRPQRTTLLGYTVPAGAKLRAHFATGPDGRSFAALSTAFGIRLYELGDLGTSGAVVPRLRATYAATPNFVPEQTRLGIIAILIGLRSTPTPVLSIQEGPRVSLLQLAGSSLTRVAAEDIAPDALGLMESEGINYFFLDGRSLNIGHKGEFRIETRLLE